MKLLPKLALSLGLAVFLLLGIEAAARVRQWAKYGTAGQIYEFQDHPASGLWIPIPGRETASMTINSLGFRGPELGPKAPGTCASRSSGARPPSARRPPPIWPPGPRC